MNKKANILPIRLFNHQISNELLAHYSHSMVAGGLPEIS